MRTLATISAIALVGLLFCPATRATAGDCVAGQQCGCGNKVCKLVCDRKKIKTICYGCKCKDICIPKPGSQCRASECVKAGKCQCGGDGGVCKIKHATGQPGCARQRTINQLVKYEVTKEVLVYKWVVVDACNGDCGCAK